MSTPSEPDVYPRLLRRLQGVFIDGVIVPLAALAALLAVTYAGVESTWIKVAVPLLVIFALEPFAVSWTGGSIGHHLVGIRVRKVAADERVGLIAATVRLVVKSLFCLPAFFVMLITRRRQGLHDLASGSLVVHTSTRGLPSYEKVPARTRDDEHAAYVSIWRRLFVVVLYAFLFYMACSLLMVAVISGPCAQLRQCSSAQSIVALAVTVLLIIGLIAIAVLGWRGRLYGARRQGIAA